MRLEIKKPTRFLKKRRTKRKDFSQFRGTLCPWKTSEHLILTKADVCAWTTASREDFFDEHLNSGTVGEGGNVRAVGF